jgi:hypothetical protein
MIGSVASLDARRGARIKWVPISGDVAALVEMRVGGFDFAASVGSPPTVAATANGTQIDVVWVQEFPGPSCSCPSR